ncbi:MAG: carboxylesterase/lipase family protein [Halioglobus sp.]
MKKAAILLVIAIATYAFFSTRPEPELTPAANSLRSIEAGELVGFEDSENTHAWLGIPYAASTAGENRWRAPQPAPGWEGTREALGYGETCPQLASLFAGAEGEPGAAAGSEDCLTLNIWAPRFDEDAIPSGDSALPVMVWIHGGGNTVGASSQYPAPILAGREKLIVVTINYRLGLLGWFSHPALHASAANAEDASGNYGTLDTIAALQWVQENISAFGGNPSNVTVFGESAGGRNVYMLLASPLAKGLFQRAIAQSGAASTTPVYLAQNTLQDNPPGEENSSGETVLRLLIQTGKASSKEEAASIAAEMPEREMASFLRSQSLAQLLAGLGTESGMYSAPQTVRDGYVLPAQTLYEQFENPKNYNSVPTITGTNRDELKLFMAMDPEYSDRVFGLIPRIKDQASFDNEAAYHSDRWKLAAVDHPADIMTAGGHPSLYAYRFDWDEGGSVGITDWSTALGAAHALEIPFVFGDFEGLFPIPRLFTAGNRKGREALSAGMMSYWAQFARTGNPGTGRKGELPQWTTWQSGRGGMMLLDSPAGGGIRMSDNRLTLAYFRRRLENDTIITETNARCELYTEMFNSSRWGQELFDSQEYAKLGCETE